MKEKIINIFNVVHKNLEESGILDYLKRNYKYILIILLVVLTGIGYLLGHVHNSKDRLISNVYEALKDGSCDKLRKEVRVQGEKVKAESLEPLMKYYDSDSSKIESAISKLKDGEDTEVFSLKTKNGILGEKYYLDLKTYSLSIESNYHEGSFTIDEKNYVNANEKIENLIPGIYEIKGSLYSEYGEIKENKDILLMANQEETINFKAINVNISSIYNDAEVYINGEDTNKTVEEIGEIGPLPTDGSVSINLEKEFPWGKIESEKVQVRDIPQININLNMNNEELEDDLKDVADSFYNSVFNALNKEDKDQINNSTENVKNKIYDILEKKYIFLKNKYTIEDIDIMNDKNEYYYDGNTYKATIVVKVNYNIEKSLFGLNKTSNSKMFFTKVVYEDGSWKIEDVENFSL